MSPQYITNSPCSFGSGILTGNRSGNCIQTRCSPIDLALGGGIYPGESTLITTISGGGKTVCCCQLAGGMALNGTRVVYISTEETSRQLEPRFVSCYCDVPYVKIVDKVCESVMTPTQVELCRKLLAKLNGSVLQFVNWTDGTKDLVGTFEKMLNQMAERMGGFPEVVILDWLGGAFGKTVRVNPSAHRAHLKRGACAMAELAEKFKIHTITTAQANVKQCVGRSRVDASALSEDRTLGDPMTNVLGISALHSETADADDGNESQVYRREQFFFLSKARGPVSRRITVLRDFRFQRFLLPNS